MFGAPIQRLERRLGVNPALIRAFMRLPRGSRLRRAILRRTAVALGEGLNRRDWSTYFQELVELFPDYRVELAGIDDPGDETLVFRWKAAGTGGLSGAPAEALIRQTLEIRRGRIARISEQLDRSS